MSNELINKIFIIGKVWPNPSFTAAGRRMYQLLKLFHKKEYEIHFGSTSQKPELLFENFEFSVSSYQLILNHTSFDELIREMQPQIVLYDRFMTEEQFGWRVSENCPQAITLLDTEDLHFLREGRQKAYVENKKFKSKYLYNQILKRELASIYRCDLSLMISKFEFNLLHKTFNISKSLLFYMPLLHDYKEHQEMENLPYSERSNFVFVGNFLHPPNKEAVDRLYHKLWRKIKSKLPDAELHIYGAFFDRYRGQYKTQQEGLHFKTYTKDIRNRIKKYRVNVAPLNFGAGLKGKVFDAMQAGTPNIMSSIAAEGIFTSSKAKNLITRNEEEFIDKAVVLYQNPSLWAKAQDLGFELLANNFSLEEYYNKLFKCLDKIDKKLTNHRRKNVVGNILNHHQYQSTKYMSKWIETKQNLEKNVKKQDP